MNLLKRVRINETQELQLRIDAVNLLNHPNFGDPNLNINTPNNDFGRITTATGSRAFSFQARLNF